MKVNFILKKAMGCISNIDCFDCPNYHNKCREFLYVPHLFEAFVKPYENYIPSSYSATTKATTATKSKK